MKRIAALLDTIDYVMDRFFTAFGTLAFLVTVMLGVYWWSGHLDISCKPRVCLIFAK